MPRRSRGPRLYLDPIRKQWAIRDGTSFYRTGCAEGELAKAEEKLAEYIGSKYTPPSTPAPIVADILLAYKNEHVPGKLSGSIPCAPDMERKYHNFYLSVTQRPESNTGLT